MHFVPTEARRVRRQRISIHPRNNFAQNPGTLSGIRDVWLSNRACGTNRKQYFGSLRKIAWSLWNKSAMLEDCSYDLGHVATSHSSITVYSDLLDRYYLRLSLYSSSQAIWTHARQG